MVYARIALLLVLALGITRVIILMMHTKNKPSAPMPSIRAATPQPVGQWNVEWVLLLHVSGDAERYSAVQQTWFRALSEDVGLVHMGRERLQPTQQQGLNSPMGHGSAFHNTRQAFALALQAFPFAQYIAKFDDDAYVYTRELFRAVRADDQNGTHQYWGYPILLDGHTFGSGGAGYVLSRSAAQKLTQCESPIPYEDAGVGDCLRRYGIRLRHLVGLHPHHPFQMLRWDKTGHPSDRVPMERAEVMQGYMAPLSYHYMPPPQMLSMHDDIHLHGAPLRRSRAVPHVMHQFWEGEHGRPERLLYRCKAAHRGWQHIVWDNALIKQRFPSGENYVGMLPTDGVNGQLVNQDFYDRAVEKNLLSDIARYEVLMLYGGVYVDADSECLRSVDQLLHDRLAVAQGVGFLEKDWQYLDGLVASGVIATFPFSPLTITLIALLRDTNWGEPPWISAGPMHFTKTLKRFQHKGPAYWEVLILDSILVYPYHYSTSAQRPADPTLVLVEKGALMDQRWGTTHGSYSSTDGGLWKEVQAREEALGEGGWLQSYARDVHSVGLSALALLRPRWVVAEVDPDATPCQHKAHLASALALALATGRVLLSDWQDLPLNYSYAAATALFGQPERALMGVMPEELRCADLDVAHSAPVLVVRRSDWWAGPLVTQNRLYRDYVFANRSEEAIHAELVGFLFGTPPCEEDAPPLQLEPRCPAASAVYVYALPYPHTDEAIQEMQRAIVAHPTHTVVCFVRGQLAKWHFLRYISSGRVIVVEGNYSRAHPAVSRYAQVLPIGPTTN